LQVFDLYHAVRIFAFEEARGFHRVVLSVAVSARLSLRLILRRVWRRWLLGMQGGARTNSCHFPCAEAKFAC
jgi:hypothetical protein